MTIFFLDPEGGNDAGDGLTFATRWQSIQLGATAARIAPGDTIRIIASPDPASIGSATWTDGQQTVVTAAAVVDVIEDCETAWTASANVTAGTTSNRKIGTQAATLQFATAFATGKAAYKAVTSPVDLAGRQQISLYAINTAPVGSLELRLCSDLAGDVPLYTIPLDNGVLGTSSKYRQIVKDFGAAMSGIVQSVAIYANTDPGAITITLDNIIASPAGGLTHLSLVGKATAGEPQWYPIQGFDGSSTIRLGCGTADSMPGSALAYRGTSETVTTYQRAPLRGAVASQSGRRTVQDSGTHGLPITFSGGWDRTDMSTQAGVSWISGEGTAATILDFAGRSYIAAEKIGICHTITSGIAMADGADCLDLQFEGFSGDAAPLTLSAVTLGATVAIDFGHVCGAFSPVRLANSSAYRRTKLKIASVTMCPTYAVELGARLVQTIECDLGVAAKAGSNMTVRGYDNYGDVLIRGGTFNAWQDYTTGGHLYFDNCNIASVTPGLGAGCVVHVTNLNGDPTAHGTYRRGHLFYTDAATVHTPGGVSWRMAKLYDGSDAGPLTAASEPLTRLAVAANVPVTVWVWLRRDHASMVGRLRLAGGSLIGVPDDAIGITTGPVDEWEQIGVSFLPTAAGVAEILAEAYWDGPAQFIGNYNVWFDDVSVIRG